MHPVPGERQGQQAEGLLVAPAALEGQAGQPKAPAPGPEQGNARRGEPIPEQVAEVADDEGVLHHPGQRAGCLKLRQPPYPQTHRQQAVGEAAMAEPTAPANAPMIKITTITPER